MGEHGLCVVILVGPAGVGERRAPNPCVVGTPPGKDANSFAARSVGLDQRAQLTSIQCGLDYFS